MTESSNEKMAVPAVEEVAIAAPLADDGAYELRMAALVKSSGLFGRLYMAGIGQFWHLIFYPALTRQWERAWREWVDRIGTENGELG